MKKQLLLFAMILLPLVASAHDIEVQNADGVTIYYNYINDGTELEVAYRGSSYDEYTNEYQGNVAIPEEVTYMNRTRKVTSVGDGAFLHCKGLTSVTIPNSVTSIGGEAFYYCKGLTSVTIPNSVTSIGFGAFLGCSGIKKVIVKDIAAWCGIKFGGYDSNPLFYAKHIYSDEDTEITNLIIPNSVTTIGNYAFYYCKGLTSVTIPNSVTSFGYAAFDGVDIPTVISLIENPLKITGRTWNGGTFSQNTFNNATLYVPKGTIEKYKATGGWKDFAYIVEGTPTGIKVIENTQKKNATVYDLNGVRLSESKKGINIINGQKVIVK